MRTYFIFFICILTGLRVSGQSVYGYEEGTIITKQGETINCFVEMAVGYEKTIFYKDSKDGKILSIPTAEVKAVATRYTYFENIPIGKKEKMMAVLVYGRAQLFFHVKDYIYVLKKDGIYYQLRKKNYLELLVQALRDCPQIIKMLGSRMYKYEFQDLERIVTEYNSCQLP